MEKLQKCARFLDVFFKYLYRFVLAIYILELIIIGIFLFLCLGSPALFGDITSLMVTKLHFGNISFQVAEGLAQGSRTGQIYYLAGLTIGLLGLIGFVLAIRNIRKILAPMKQALPFDASVATGFRNLGFLCIADGILNVFSQYFLDGSIIRAYDLQQLFLSGKILSVSYRLSFDFSFLLTALVFFGLSWVFRYGQELQQLSDETL